MAFATVEIRKQYHRQYYADHRKEILARYRERYSEDAVLRKSKSEYRKTWWDKTCQNWAKYKRYTLKRAKHRAKVLGLPFNLTPDDIIIPEVCPILGIPLRVAKGRHDDNSPALDRIIPNLGYVKGNVMVISQRANVLKRDASLEELERLVDGLRRITQKRRCPGRVSKVGLTKSSLIDSKAEMANEAEPAGDRERLSEKTAHADATVRANGN